MAKDPSNLIPPSPSEADYRTAAKDGGEELAGADPFALFTEWFEQAKASEPADANAMSLATADAEGRPDVRMVLLKDVSADGFVFYTNTESAKGLQLAANPHAALGFHWKSLERQVRIRGAVSPVTEAEADAYFASRARDARIGAWASEQSRPLEGRFELQARIAKFAAKFGLGEIPRPPHWSGYRLVPETIEFWRAGAFRLHDRLAFERENPDAPWRTSKLFP
ncbi:MAG: pyridoxamine 5'-phosphate oxidase [Maricaulaceae bacterium]|jgi:pyridoxamine 5'-phosphate oxidase